MENCHVCVDVKAWQAKARQIARLSTEMASQSVVAVSESAAVTEHPPDAGELGRATWTFIHTMSTYYPERPSLRQQSQMRSFLAFLGDFYPCGHCAAHFRDAMERDPPRVATRDELMLWLCQRHNEINEMQGKPAFDCRRYLHRWRK